MIIIIPLTDIITGLFRTLRHFIDDMMHYLVEERLARIYRDESLKHPEQAQPQAQTHTQATASGSTSSTGTPIQTNADTPPTTTVTQPATSNMEVDTGNNDSP